MRKIFGRARRATLRATLLAPLLATVAAGTACRSAPANRGVALADAGAAAPGVAVERFLAAARANDPGAMGLLFGTAAGPVAARDPGAEVEKRMRALACYLGHDSARLVNDLPAVGGGTRRVLTVALRQGELARETRFTAVPGPRGRWYVESFDIERVSDFCRPR